MDKSLKVRQFYTDFPYPSKQIDSNKNLFKNAQWITQMLGFNPNEFPVNSLILEAGCGTGEFSCGFALSEKSKITGIDLSPASIEKAKKNAVKFHLKNVSFKEADVLVLPFKDNSFDYVFSLGCVHHTTNPKNAVKEICRVLKPNGFLVLGVYNKYGRFITRIKKLLLDLMHSKNDLKKIELANKLFYSNKNLTEQKKIWIADKYLHPNEFFHSIPEVLNWFKENKIEYLNKSIPEIILWNSNPYSNSNKLNYFLIQLNWLLKEKSFFILTGKKKA
ncbi:MAG: class I SAM-dependent methyltransferase [Candidatus Diapherotrites archaeon]|nr:class I SAM-dependent methyltransferase [Candidatus Diapherotrites archaeon]